MAWWNVITDPITNFFGGIWNWTGGAADQIQGAMQWIREHWWLIPIIIIVILMIIGLVEVGPIMLLSGVTR